MVLFCLFQKIVQLEFVCSFISKNPIHFSFSSHIYVYIVQCVIGATNNNNDQICMFIHTFLLSLSLYLFPFILLSLFFMKATILKADAFTMPSTFCPPLSHSALLFARPEQKSQNEYVVLRRNLQIQTNRVQTGNASS